MGAATPPSYTQDPLPGNTVTASAGTTLTSDLAPYIGTGIHDLPFLFTAGTGTYAGSGAVGVFFGGSATADAKITIVYNYTAAAIPEPASMGLLGIGMAGLLTFRRFFNKRSSARTLMIEPSRFSVVRRAQD